MNSNGLQLTSKVP